MVLLLKVCKQPFGTSTIASQAITLAIVIGIWMISTGSILILPIEHFVMVVLPVYTLTLVDQCSTSFNNDLKCSDTSVCIRVISIVWAFLTQLKFAFKERQGICQTVVLIMWLGHLASTGAKHVGSCSG